jgi:hypothetical protein
MILNNAITISSIWLEWKYRGRNQRDLEECFGGMKELNYLKLVFMRMLERNFLVTLFMYFEKNYKDILNEKKFIIGFI